MDEKIIDLVLDGRLFSDYDDRNILTNLADQLVRPAAPESSFGSRLRAVIDFNNELIAWAETVFETTFDLEREEMRAFYERHYGAGFDYAYTIPAMAKAVQAAGRVIRSETDRGLIVLLDGRFVQHGLFPRHARGLVRVPRDELVSGSILKDVSDFWGSPSSSPASARGCE